MKLRDFQSRDVEKLRAAARKHKSVVYVAPTGCGKCHAIDTPILMYDGRVKMVQHIQVGDRLMGPDSTPRNVLSLAAGTDCMYEVTPLKGSPFIVNAPHMLSLKHTTTRRVINLSVVDYMQRSKNFKHLHKLYRTGVNFKDHNIRLVIDPYILGVWLGDGTTRLATITTGSEIIKKAWVDFAESHGCTIRAEQGSNCEMLYARTDMGKANPVLQAFQAANLIGNKHIPANYLTASRTDRLALLAGLLDTDGYLNKGGYEIIQKSNALSENILFLARSLGFAAYSSKKIGTIKSRGFSGIYNRIYISGHVNLIPCRLKKASPRKHNKDVLVTGFSVKFVGTDYYYGFGLDGDHLYLMGDFTVTHNTISAAYIMESALSMGKRVLFLAHRRELVVQAFEKLLKFDVTAGIWMAGFSLHLYRRVQVGSVQTINAQMKKGRTLPHFDLIVTDECHRALAQSYQNIYDQSDAFHIGLTATPIRSDGRGLGGTYKAMVLAPTQRELTEMGYLVPAIYYSPSVPDLTGVDVSGGDYVQVQLDKAVLKHNELVGDVVSNWLRLGEDRQTILYAPGIKSSMALCESFNKAGIAAEHIDGNTPGNERKEMLARHKSGETRVLCNAMVLVEGYDDPAVSCIIIACPTRFLGKYIQMGGRGLRIHPDKKDCIILDHGGVIYEHGYLDDEIPWVLDATKDPIGERKQELDAKEPKQFTCENCFRVFSGTLYCPHCGTKITIHGKEIVASEADLIEWKRSGPSPMEKTEESDRKASFYAQLLTHCDDKGYKAGWAAHKYQLKFSEWPGQSDKREPIGPEVKRWITYINIRNARRKK